MNVPEVVQALSRMTEFIAVPWSPIQFWLGAIAEELEDRVEPKRRPDLVEQAVGCAEEDPEQS